MEKRIETTELSQPNSSRHSSLFIFTAAYLLVLGEVLPHRNRGAGHLGEEREQTRETENYPRVMVHLGDNW